MRFLLAVFLLCAALPAKAELTIEITGAGEHQIPISLVRFAGEDQMDAASSISSVVSNDLAAHRSIQVDRSGRQGAA